MLALVACPQLLLFAAVQLGGPQVSKSARVARMLDIAARRDVAREAGASDAAERLDSAYRTHSEALGGDDPAATSAIVALTASGPPLFTSVFLGASSSPLGAVSALQASTGCTAASATSQHVGSVGPINDISTQQFTCSVSGVSGVVWDIETFLDVDHTYSADLDITLSSPSGVVVTLTTDNGGGAVNAYAGTLFSESAATGVTDFAYLTQPLPISVLAPEGRFEAFRGLNPNGVWTLTVTDDAAGDLGFLRSFRLDVAAVPALPATSTTNAVRVANVPLFDNGTRLDNLTVAGAAGVLQRLEVRIDVTHSYPADLDIRLLGPAGAVVVLTTDNGGPFDDVFAGTTFVPTHAQTVSDRAYQNSVVATPLSPEGPFSALYGIDPNGTWQLQLTDDSFGDVGFLNGWELILTTCTPCNSNVLAYCTPSTTSSGCAPLVSASSSRASISAGPGSFVIRCDQVEGQKFGIFFYGLNGGQALPWWPGSTSTFCVKTPTQRMRQINSGGQSNTCSGVCTEDFFDYALNFNPLALGNPLTPGQRYNAQLWFRDPAAPKTTNLSDALEFSLCP